MHPGVAGQDHVDQVTDAPGLWSAGDKLALWHGPAADQAGGPSASPGGFRCNLGEAGHDLFGRRVGPFVDLQCGQRVDEYATVVLRFPEVLREVKPVLVARPVSREGREGVRLASGSRDLVVDVGGVDVPRASVVALVGART